MGWRFAAVAAAAVTLGACGGTDAEPGLQDGTEVAANDAAVTGDATAGTVALPDAGAASTEAGDAREVTVYASPTCGCCKKWVSHMQEHGYEVRTVYNSDISSIKRRLGVPDRLQSCHTAVVGGYLVEGHVPADAVTRLLEQRPDGVRGLAVPGMPTGSPGMEVPGVPADPYDVVAFSTDGRTSVYESH